MSILRILMERWAPEVLDLVLSVCGECVCVCVCGEGVCVCVCLW